MPKPLPLNPDQVKMAEFTGHSARVLHMAQSPDGTTVVSAAADETLRFWRAFGSGEEVAKARKTPTPKGLCVNPRVDESTQGFMCRQSWVYVSTQEFMCHGLDSSAFEVLFRRTSPLERP